MGKKFYWGSICLLLVICSFSNNSLAAPAGNWVSDFTLFNLGTDKATYSMTSYPLCTSGCTQDTGTQFFSGEIAKDGSAYYNPANDSNFTSGFAGSVVVSSDQALAGTVTLANGLSGSSYASDAYSAVTNPSNSVILPIVMAGAGPWYTRISVQNTGTSAANLQIDYVGTNAPSQTTINGLPPNMTAWVDQIDQGSLNFNGSARITSTNSQPLAVVVEEYKTSGGVLISYNGLPVTEAGPKVYLPGYIDQGSWATDFTIVNTSGTPAQVVLSFSGVANTLSGTLPANGAQYFNRTTTGVPSGWTGSFPTSYYGAATVTSTGGNVVVAYNIANSASGGSGNLQVGYLGFPTSKAVKNVVVPLIENEYGAGKWITTYSVQSIDGAQAQLTLTYSGNTSPNCNPCTAATDSSGFKTFNQKTDGHVPSNFIGGVAIASDRDLVVIGDQTSFTAFSGGDTAAGFAGVAKN